MKMKVSDLTGKTVVSATRRRQGGTMGRPLRWTHTLQFDDGTRLVIDDTGYRIHAPRRIKHAAECTCADCTYGGSA